MEDTASLELKATLKEENMKYQLVPLHNHCTHLTENAIRTVKNHFITGLESVDPDYSVREWDRLIPQAEQTLNLLRTAQKNLNNQHMHRYIC